MKKEKGRKKDSWLVRTHVITRHTLGKKKKVKKGTDWFKPMHS